MRLMLAVALVVLGLLRAGLVPAAPRDSPWGGDYFSNVPLVTHEGSTVRLYDDLIKDKIVIVSFIFTDCRVQCPLITANLAQVQRLLGDRVGRDVFMVSISIDPEHDTPAVLKDYASRFNAGPGWLFLTGKPEDIKLVRRKFRDTQPIADHAGQLKIGNDKTGQWVSTSAVDSPRHIAKVVGDWISDWKPSELPPRSAQVDAASGPGASRGSALFQKACAACHHIGGGDLVGPDLEGVLKRRERAWLTRLLIAPDRMIDGSDPIATQLYARYKVRMPNLGLTERDAMDLITYLEARSEVARK